MPDPITPDSAAPGGPAMQAEPVAWRFDATASQTTSYTSRKDRADHRRTIPGFVVTPLYAHPADAESLRAEVERLRAYLGESNDRYNTMIRAMAAEAGCDARESAVMIAFGRALKAQRDQHLTPPPDADLTPAARDVLAERRRQVEVEGWDADHDDEHNHGELAGAAAAYATLHSHLRPEVVVDEELMQLLWPFSPAWLKPTGPRRDLVKAGALILAEIERLDREAARAAGEPK